MKGNGERCLFFAYQANQQHIISTLFISNGSSFGFLETTESLFLEKITSQCFLHYTKSIHSPMVYVGLESKMSVIRRSKLMCVLLFTLLVTLEVLGNIPHLDSVIARVYQIFALDSVFPASAALHAAIDGNYLAVISYLFILLLEIVTMVTCWVGSFMMWRALRLPARQFNRSKHFAILGITLGLLTWSVAYILFGEKWFNLITYDALGANSAPFRFLVIMLLLLIYLVIKDKETMTTRANYGQH